MSTQRKRGKGWTVIGIFAAAVVVLGVVAAANSTRIAALVRGATGTRAATTTATTTAIQPATVAQTAVSASGKLTLADERSVALGVSGVVNAVNVKVGDSVTKGAVLLKLDTTDLERALAQAKLTVDSAKVALAKLQAPATAAQIASAQAALKEAQENLASVKAGPSAAEVAAARSSLASAQAAYSDLKAGPTDDKKTQLSASLKQAEVALQKAQHDYDQIAWRSDAGASSQAATLQDATISYESAKAAYDEAVAPATQSDTQAKLSAIQSAQKTLDDLLNSPSAADVAAAEAKVAAAESSLNDLQKGPTNEDVQAAKITLQQGLISLEQAQRNLAAATVTAPIAGVVTGVNATVGVRSAADAVVVTLADPQQLELKVNVAEADIPKVSANQAATVTVDALPGKSFAGAVSSISPVADSTSSAVNYPVTVRLTGDNLTGTDGTGVKPGMNAVATLATQQAATANSWLVPTNAIRTQNGASTVTVVRASSEVTVKVTPGSIQGEWTLVVAPDLQSGDKVIGSVTSKTGSGSSNSNRSGAAGLGAMGGAMGGAGGPPPGN